MAAAPGAGDAPMPEPGGGAAAAASQIIAPDAEDAAAGMAATPDAHRRAAGVVQAQMAAVDAGLADEEDDGSGRGLLEAAAAAAAGGEGGGDGVELDDTDAGDEGWGAGGADSRSLPTAPRPQQGPAVHRDDGVYTPTRGAAETAAQAAGPPAEGEEDVEVYVFEYERKFPFRGYSASHLTGADRANWANRRGNRVLSKAWARLHPGFRWVTDWVCDMLWAETDDNGWQYAGNFMGKGPISRYSGREHYYHCVRRRRWFRVQRGPRLPPVHERLAERLSDAQRQEMAEAVCPIFYMHSEDEYFPSSMPEYLAHCELWHGHQRVLAEGEVDSVSLVQARLVRPPDEEGSPPVEVSRAVGDEIVRFTGTLRGKRLWHLKCNHGFHHGMGPARLPEVPVYAHITDGLLLGEPVYSVCFDMFFPYNGARKVRFDESGNRNTLQGGHEADAEHCRVFVSKITARIFAVYYGAHRGCDGTLRTLDSGKIEMAGDGRPVVYVAKDGHGTYPNAGTYQRIFFMANDYCDRGFVWRPPVEVVPLPFETDKVRAKGMQWLWYAGKLGSSYQLYRHCSIRELDGHIARPGGSPHGIYVKDYFYGEGCGTRSWFKRVFRPMNKSVREVWRDIVQPDGLRAFLARAAGREDARPDDECDDTDNDPRNTAEYLDDADLGEQAFLPVHFPVGELRDVPYRPDANDDGCL